VKAIAASCSGGISAAQRESSARNDHSAMAPHPARVDLLNTYAARH
jgi:hypothetical protein